MGADSKVRKVPDIRLLMGLQTTGAPKQRQSKTSTPAACKHKGLGCVRPARQLPKQVTSARSEHGSHLEQAL